MGNATVFPLSRLAEVREESRQIAIENAWNEFLDKVTRMRTAQDEMHEAHLRYIKLMGLAK